LGGSLRKRNAGAGGSGRAGASWAAALPSANEMQSSGRSTPAYYR
jgi:hypothetical protein